MMGNAMHQTVYLIRSRVAASTLSDCGEIHHLALAALETQSAVLKHSKKTATQLLDSHGLGPTHLVQTVNVQRHAKATPLGTALWITPTSSPSSATGDHVPAKCHRRSMYLKTLGA